MSGKLAPVRSRLVATSLLALACVASCNALTGVNQLEFADAPSGTVAVGELADAGAPAPPTSVIGSLLGVCDALEGSGCAEGQVCRFHREAGEPRCTPAPAAPLQPYAACRRDDECPGSFLCEAGVCSRPCQSAADCGWANARCLPSADGQLLRCSRSCDLVAAHTPRAGLQACGEGTRCDFVPEQGEAGYTDCFAATDGAFAVGTCAAHDDCPTDFRCHGQRCGAACGTSVSCGDGLSCGATLELAGQAVGVCCSIPAGQACDLLSGCGCPPGASCSLDAAGAVACRALRAEPLAAYARCEQQAECPARHSCIGGACKLHCNVTEDCGAEGAQCVSVSLADAPGLAFCARGCDVLSPQSPTVGFRACGSGTSCVDATAELAAADCTAAGSGTQGATCTGPADCAPGYGCLAGSCQRWCAPAGMECGLGLSCGGVHDVGGRALGNCCAPPLDQACDWVTDCGCAAGETCSVDAGALRSCRVVDATPVPAYFACDVETQCPQFHHCAIGVCMRRCETSSDCPGDAQCLVLNEDDPDTGICSRHCDMLSPSAPAPGFQPCGPGLRCLDFEGPEGATTACISAGPVGAGGACADTGDCTQGLDCEAGTCLPLCELGGDGCAAGTVCSPRELAPVPVGGRRIGVCVVGA